jgi:ABC-type antimicrobial peptide transport system permease subunit
MSRALVLTFGGLFLGAVAALGLTRLLGYLLYKVSPHDPLVFASAFLVLMFVSLIACFLPAWRATTVDPMVALRHE